MKKAVQRFLPTRSVSASSLKKSFKIDSINLIQDFFVDLDEPHKSWRPGETITGVVVLDLKKNIVDVNITLTLVGYIKIKQGTNTTNVRNKPALLFRHTSTIYGFDPNDGSPVLDHDEPLTGLSRGEHRFPFSVKLPKKNIFTSISFEKGSISYSLRASINHNSSSSPNTSTKSSPASQVSASTIAQISPHPKNSIQHCDKDLTIVVPINVAKIPKPQTKYAHLRVSDRRLFKTISSTSTVNSGITYASVNSDNSNESGSNLAPPSVASKDQAIVKLSVDLPESGFLRGELVPIKIKVSHYKPVQSSAGIIVTLMRLCRVDNGPESPIQSFRKDLCQTVAPLYIDPETLTGEVSTSLRVPAEAFPTIVGSDIVTFQYYVEILANLSHKNAVRNGNGSTPKKGSTKFSHSLVFDMDQQPDHTMAEESMVNVDVLKRAKNFLGLNTEIIVGTERVFKKKATNGSTFLAQKQREGGREAVLVDAIDPALVDGISQTSISPISINGPAISPGASTTVQEVPSPETSSGLSEKETLRLREEALLPSEPTIYEDDSPAPSYAPAVSTSAYDAPPVSDVYPEEENPDSDKAELERRRLLVLESEPPEFDYVPEYPTYEGDRTATPSIVSAPPPPASEQETLRG